MASGLKCLQWLARGVQLVASAVVLGITSYYLASLLRASLTVPTSVKAVEGIAAAATVYTALGVLFACCCCAPVALLTAVVDVGLAAAFVYVAVANRGGASACSGSSVSTVYGSGAASATPSAAGGGGSGGSGVLGLPTYGMACRLETACLAAACVAILFFLVTILLALSPSRHRGRDRGAASRRAGPRHVDGDGEYFAKSPMYDTHPSPYHNNYTAAGAMPAPPPRAGLLGGLFRRQNTYRGAPMEQQQQQHPDALPAHQQPSDMATRQEELPMWGEVVSLGGGGGEDNDELFFNEARDVERDAPVRFTPTTAPRPAAETYEEGEVPAEWAERGYNMYGSAAEGQEGQQGGARGERDLAETSGRGLGRHRESREARMERFAVG